MTQVFKVLWAGSAVQDLESIIAYIGKDSPANARKTLLKIKKTVSELCSFPQRGRFTPELQTQGILLYRELVVAPWRIMYRVSDNTVLVLSVFDSRQNIEDILLKKMLNLKI
jgi:plasmid stabilization system protein ParE